MVNYGDATGDCVRSLGQSSDAILFAFDCSVRSSPRCAAGRADVSPVQGRLNLVAGGQTGSYATEGVQ